MNRIILFALFVLAAVAEAQVVFSLNKSVYTASETITATWSGRTGGTTSDWVGIYPSGTLPGGPASTRWAYVNGTNPSGTVNFTNPGLTAGNWTAYFLANDSYDILGSATFSVSGGASPRTLTSFALNKSSFRPGETITATWAGLTVPASTDWVGIYPRNLSGVPDGNPASTIWYYVNGTRTATTGSVNGSVTFTNPGLPVGQWRAYFLLNDGYQFLSTMDFEVSLPSILAFGADHAFIDDSPVITLSWALNNTTPVTSLTISDGTLVTNVLGSEILDVTPLMNTTYTLTVNGTDTAKATVFKNAAQSPGFSLDSLIAATTDGVDVSWNGVTGAANSWVGIYRAGETPGPFPAVQWNFLNGTKTAGGSHPVGILSFNPPPGEYFAVLFGNSGHDLVERGPIRFTVAEGPFKPLAITSSGFDGGDFRVEWDSVPTKRYDLEVSENLVHWTAVKRNWMAESNRSTLFAAPLQNGSGYYRIREK